VSDVLEEGIKKALEDEAASADPASDPNGNVDPLSDPNGIIDPLSDPNGNVDPLSGYDAGSYLPENVDPSGIFPPTPEINPEDALIVTGNPAEGIDIDLTLLSPIMIYSEVYYMVTMPEKYIGLKVRMQGDYATYEDPVSGIVYHGCIIKDATQCCAQGIEFEPTSDYAYPADYPTDGTLVTVTGTFDTYEEDGNTFFTLRNSEMSF